MKNVILIFLAACLLAVLGFRFYFSLVPPPEPSLKQPLAEILPKQLAGWQVEEHDMAESPEASARISDFLNFDDAIFRTYRRGDTFIGVYVAYWKPGKASYRWAGAHTPDTCWVQNGWTRSERKYSVPLNASGIPFKPAEFGVYVKDGHPQKVYFWHLIGGNVYSFNQHNSHNIWGSLLDIKKHGLDLRKEQFFVRFSSNKALTELEELEGMHKILQALAHVGLRKG